MNNNNKISDYKNRLYQPALKPLYVQSILKLKIKLQGNNIAKLA